LLQPLSTTTRFLAIFIFTRIYRCVKIALDCRIRPQIHDFSWPRFSNRWQCLVVVLSELTNVYLVTEVAGQSQATLDAKRRDLQRFLSFYQYLYEGHDRPEEWFVSVTKAFLKHLQKERLAQTSLVRIYATVRHFSRWLHRKFPELFPLGCPSDGVKPPAEPAADWKGLTRVQEIRLLSAAQSLRARRTPGSDQGLRNHALLAVLLGSGLRSSEVLNLDRGQYTGKGFSRVAVKGGGVCDFVPVQRDVRQVLNGCLESRKDDFPALFPTRSGRAMHIWPKTRKSMSRHMCCGIRSCVSSPRPKE
jgi:site-specific recombinase XerD